MAGLTSKSSLKDHAKGLRAWSPTPSPEGKCCKYKGNNGNFAYSKMTSTSVQNWSDEVFSSSRNVISDNANSKSKHRSTNRNQVQHSLKNKFSSKTENFTKRRIILRKEREEASSGLVLITIIIDGC